MSGIGKNKNQGKCTKISDENGTIYENFEVASFLNEFYVNVGPSLAQKHTRTWEKENCKMETNSTFNFQWVTEREVQKLVEEICITKSSAIDNLSTRYLKDAFQIKSFELAYMFNSCLQHGIFPKAWGLSKVTPIPKTTSKSTKPGDWRPISQICITGKLLKKIIHYQLYSYLEENKLLSENQYGFRKDRSTGLAIFDVLRDLFDNWNENKYSCCIFVDFSRAFDSIDHNILAEKLKLYGLDVTSQRFMMEYMTCRKQTTIVNSCVSPEAQVTYGTAQGSILGPLIIILYVNDIFKTIDSENSIRMYADDTLLICKDENINKVTEKAQDAFQNIENWCEENKLTINVDKTKFMLVKHVKPKDEPKLVSNGSTINTVHQTE